MLKLVVIRARDMEKLASFYAFCFVRHRHGKGAEHLSSNIGEAVFEIYPASSPGEPTTATRRGFSVPSLSQAVERVRGIGATILNEPADTPFGRRAVVQDFEGHKVELYETALFRA